MCLPHLLAPCAACLPACAWMVMVGDGEWMVMVLIVMDVWWGWSDNLGNYASLLVAMGLDQGRTVSDLYERALRR